MATGYFWSILAMMSAPFLIIAVLTLLIVRTSVSGTSTSRLAASSVWDPRIAR